MDKQEQRRYAQRGVLWLPGTGMKTVTQQPWMPGYFVVPMKNPCDPIHLARLEIHCLTHKDPAVVEMARQYISAIEATDKIIWRLMQ